MRSAISSFLLFVWHVGKPQAAGLKLLIPLFLLVMTLFSGCSIEQNTITSNAFHNLTAHYNGYYYAREKAREVEKTILKTLDDDPTQVLRLFPQLDTTKAKGYVKDTEEIIKMASISIQRHPNSKWVDNNYVMVGLARLYACDFQNAILTFKYVNTKSPSYDTRQTALIYLLRTFIEQGDMERAEEVFRFLEKEKLISKQNVKKLYLEKAYYYQIKNDYNNMVQNLSKADSLLTRQDRKGRIYFIIGQVYQKLGFNSEAYNYYRKCLATNPDYEIDFYARLNMAQVAQIEDKGDVRLVRKQFSKLLADGKNVAFKDKIYFEWGEFERKQGNLTEAITNYKSAAHAGKSKRIQGQAYLRVGQLNFDSLKKYSLAKLYYDSAVGSLPKDFENYEAIKKRQEILGEFATYTETISLNDSLLQLASFDSLTLRKRLDSVFSIRDKKLATVKKKKKKSDNGSTGGNAQNNTFFTPAESTSTSDWYFGNSALVAAGQSEFQRLWGSIPLEDNWRRSNKSTVIADSGPLRTQKPSQESPQAPSKVAEAKPDEKLDEAGKLIAQLPKTEKQKEEALGKIEKAYFKLGDLYYFNLNEKTNAAESYQKLLGRFPQSEFKPEVLYKLYLIYRESDNGQASKYAQLLKDEYPHSTFTKILNNPDYLKETSVAAEKQKLIYKEAYAYYRQNNLRAAQEKIGQAIQVGETGFTPQIELLKILMVGKTEDVTRYQFELESFIKKYPAEPIKPYAEQLLAASKSLLDKIEKAKGIKFSTAFNAPHIFVTIYNTKEKITNPVVDALEKFNTTGWKDLKLTTSNLILNEEKTLTMVEGFPDRETALSYFDKFLAQVNNTKPFSNYKFYNFVITKDNFQTFYRTKALDEYLTFFDRNYQKSF
jgi:tetratricopeptide (TPR) repeat protein